ncbi:sulfate adenylyltransferase [Campylobacter canadensis]|uniref:Sulfate adenylyltransferase n=1 Tax=Campylobacter canadensis TaxID=449520 RepID=A0ABS7WV59_9BACT|nr:sulfate adenylyltransferase [Campylobacter canadensis]MBZ7987919.1 sulfate adenylyltransferase [Campylobacter canadensis]
MTLTSEKISCININKNELAILSLIQIKALSNTDRLINDEEQGEFSEFLFNSLSFYPSFALNGDLSNKKFSKKLLLKCEDEIVGSLEDVSTFSSKKKIASIFSPNLCYIENNNPGLCAKVNIYNNPYQKIKQDVENKIKKSNAKKITAIMLDASPLTRAHERMLRWTIDKADLVLIFVVDAKDEFSMQIKKECFDFFTKNYLPLDKIYTIYLENLELFSKDPNYECLLVKSFGANKFVIEQNHPGIGLLYDNFTFNSFLNELSKKTELELIILPEFAFCNQCNIMVSVKSCPHGAHHHIKYDMQCIRKLLTLGIMPPTVLIRKEISAKLLSYLFKDKIKNIDSFYSRVFPSNGIIKSRSEEEFYIDLASLYQTNYFI